MRWNLWIAFAVLCVLSGTSWAIPREMSDGLPLLEQQGGLFGVVVLVALLFAGRGVWSRMSGWFVPLSFWWGLQGSGCIGYCAGLLWRMRLLLWDLRMLCSCWSGVLFVKRLCGEVTDWLR